MNNLVQKFNAYAAVVLATLAALWTKMKSLASAVDGLSSIVNGISNTVQGLYFSLQELSSRLDQNIGTINATIGTLRADLTSGLASTLSSAKAYTDQALIAVNAAIAGINLSVFGGRTATEWETFINNTVGTAITSEETRIKAMKEVSEVKVVKLADFTGDIAFGSIAVPYEAGNATTHMFKFEAALGATAVTRNLTGLPASVNGSTTLAVDNGDEIFVTYNADGTATIVVYNDNEAAVVASVLNTQATQGSAIATLNSDVDGLMSSFDSQRILVEALLAQINGTASSYYYYAGGSGGIGTAALGV